jgi:rubrerythrin
LDRSLKTKGMMMAEASPKVAEAIKMAMELEKEGYAFFKQAAEQTDNKLGKEMFLRLAEEETKHMETFKKMFDSISNAEHWQQVASHLGATRKVPVFKDAKGKMKALREPGEVEALRQAMEIERKAIQFFSRAKSEAIDSAAKEIFDKIRAEEEYHHALLQAQYDSVMGAGFWLDTAEFRMDGMY